MAKDLLEQFTDKARSLVDDAVTHTHEKFPDEKYPVRPPYRRAVYRRFRKLKQTLKHTWEDLTSELKEDVAAVHHSGYARLEKQYLREYGVRTQKREEK